MLSVFVVMLSITGCVTWQPFAPPPDEWEYWEKKSVDKVVIWRDLLECNYPTPFSGGHRLEGGERTIEEKAAAMICMERLGYRFKSDFTLRSVCRTSGWRKTQACTLGVGIPTPDPQRRLNSGFCKAYPQSAACAP